MKLVIYISFLFLVIDVPWCRSECAPAQCLQGINPFSCPEGTWYRDNVSMGGCCPGCVRFRGPGDQCEGSSQESFDMATYYTSKTYITTGQQQPIIESQLCAPGMICNSDGKCSTYKYVCPSASDTQLYGPLWTKWRPSCDIDGSYTAVQCKTNGPDHRCFCYSKKGDRIFGFDWDTTDTRKNMHCLCSRLVEDLKKDSANKGIPLLDTFHCSSNGNFEPLQCNRGVCYCANIYTGQPTSFIVPESLWFSLPCYNSTAMGTKYLKTCDSQSNALALILEETASHGSKPLSLVAPPCDLDGSFQSKQCDGTQCYCRTRANVNIGAYFTERNTASESTQKCYCARDQVVFQDASRTHSYLCDNGGNYSPLQIIGELAFCVDSDGFMTTNAVPVADKCSGALSLCTDNILCPPNTGK